MPADDIRAVALQGRSPLPRAAALPAGEALVAVSDQLEAVCVDLDLIRLNKAERALVEHTATIDEVRLNMRYAKLCAEFPELLTELGFEPALFAQMYDLDLGLAEVRAAIGFHIQASRDAAIITAGDLTRMVDAVERAAERRTSPSADDVSAVDRLLPIARLQMLNEPKVQAMKRAALRHRLAATSKETHDEPAP